VFEKQVSRRGTAAAACSGRTFEDKIQGGLVQPGSLVRGDNLVVTFPGLPDGSAALPVAYKGILPICFAKGQGVVAEGALDSSGVFSSGHRARQA